MNKRINLALIFLVIFLLITGQPLMADEGQDELFVLDDIVVTASKYSEKLSDTTVSMDILTQEDIQEKNAQNVAELLRGLTGIYISDHGGPAGLKTIRIRGSETNQVLVLLDGQAINSSQNGEIDLSQLPVEQIERIEVLKGPASALYGANALGGVVNIITKGGSRKPITEFKVRYGSFETQQTAFSHRGNTGRVGYNITAVEKDSDGDRENSSLEQMMFFSRFDIEMDQYNDIIISFQYNDSDKGVPGPQTSPSPNAEQDDQDTNINLKWRQNKEAYDTNLLIYHNKHEQVYDNPDEWGYTEASKHNTARTGIEFNRTDYFKLHNLTYGIEFKRNKIDSNENGQHDNLNQALFIQDKWQIIEPLEISIGTRFDDHEVFGSEFSPRLGAVYSINDDLNVFASAAKAYRTPTFNDLYWPADAYTEGNPDLEPETALAYETGIRYFKQDMKLELNYFTRDVEDLINWAAGTDYIFRPYNVDEARTKGTELIFSKRYNMGVTVGFNYTYLDSRDKETDDRLAPIHNANLDLSYKKGDISSSLICHSVKNRPDELDDYTVVDVKLAKVFFFDEGESELYFKVNNLLNNKDYEVREGYPMPERNYTLGLSTKF
ncbi:TonB-dependent receptor [Halocella sp. SP3-1]|uniref:TonB-dependent receptor plug domain-containing protein n=1 Tax=Halocella sp. SP3-1 TaxID=2382161 RepID=UPI000F76434C|nr:TonB-dependent receptor [Halocella sp. SP3-1]AZO94696.1 TonB-dependent receptor [Halocella sp. SP3-1]